MKSVNAIIIQCVYKFLLALVTPLSHSVANYPPCTQTASCHNDDNHSESNKNSTTNSSTNSYVYKEKVKHIIVLCDYCLTVPAPVLSKEGGGSVMSVVSVGRWTVCSDRSYSSTEYYKCFQYSCHPLLLQHNKYEHNHSYHSTILVK